MRYAEVSVNSPAARRRTFSYAIPPGPDIRSGQAVWVPFGEKTLQGVVLELTPFPSVEETREIAGVIEPETVLTPVQISLARWISDYYLSPLFDAVALFLPPGFERKAVTLVSVTSPPDDSRKFPLTPAQEYVFAAASQTGSIYLKELEKRLGRKKARMAVSQLANRGLVTRSYEIEPPRVSPKVVPYVSLSVPAGQAAEMADELRRKKATRQAAVLELLAGQANPLPWPEVSLQTGSDRSTANRLLRKGVLAFQEVVVRREPIAYDRVTYTEPPKLTSAQDSALGRIKAALTQPQARPPVFLLHGVTGSGKTEVYLRALEETVKRGKRGIVLVPEISLTPQTIERFAARFPHRVAVIHSKLSRGERFDEWHRIRSGEADVVIGPRSAVFTPQLEMGLIVIDEEHEWTYKQTDASPGYHTRDVALKLAGLTGATVLLGSATPDLQTYYRASRGEYELLPLPGRVVPQPDAAPPEVEVVDLRSELKAGNSGLFSRSLSRAIAEALSRREQVILFLNRRGGATTVQCRRCGYVFRCRRCEVSLTQHITEDVLVCHQCNYRVPVPQTCPRCRGREMKFLGTGTQKLERAAGAAFPQARLLRWDSDITAGKNTHERVLSRFRSHQADILIGTQMVAKGLDLPLVTVVGVIDADTVLYLPDFRAAERTFQLLSQVAGRAGRGICGGRVFIQTYSPEHYAVRAAANHNYGDFFHREITYRRQLDLPPYTQLVLLTYAHTNQSRCRQETERMRRHLSEKRDREGTDDVSIVGPAPAFIPRRRGRFRWQIILRGSGVNTFLSSVPFPQGWTVDVDPVSLL